MINLDKIHAWLTDSSLDKPVQEIMELIQFSEEVIELLRMALCDEECTLEIGAFFDEYEIPLETPND